MYCEALVQVTMLVVRHGGAWSKVVGVSVCGTAKSGASVLPRGVNEGKRGVLGSVHGRGGCYAVVSDGFPSLLLSFR